MSRQLLRAVMVLGLIVTLVGGTGLFAAFTDRATTGSNDVTSGELGHAADLQIATAQAIDIGNDGISDVACDDFQEDLTTGVFSLSGGLQPTQQGVAYSAYLCLRNVGSASLELTMSAVDLTDADIACTGDEATFGDASCGVVGGIPQAGELSPLIDVNVVDLDCVGEIELAQSGWSSLAALSQNPTLIFASSSAGALLGPGETGCISLRLRYPDTAAAADIQLAQSDQVTWRFAFDGTAS